MAEAITVVPLRYAEGYEVKAPDVIVGEEERKRFRRFGTWYNSKRRMRSDFDGYMFLSQAALKPGALYVLYLWAGSRDQNAPDERILFRATRGTTDLGAVMIDSRN